MAVAQFALPYRPAFDSNGKILPGAKLYFTLAGTSTPIPVYTDASLTQPLPNPVVANQAGRFPPIYYNDNISYRVRLYENDNEVGVDTPLEEYDPLAIGAETDASVVRFRDRTVHEKLDDHINVRDYGAIGDGTSRTMQELIVPGVDGRYATLAALQADYPDVNVATRLRDWAAMMAAGRAAIARGGVYVGMGSGTFVIDGPINLGGAVGFIGAGKSATRVIYPGNTDCFAFVSHGGGWAVKDMNLLASGPISAGAGIRVDAAGGGSIDNVEFNFAYDAITIKNTQDTWINNITGWEFLRYGVGLLGNNVSVYLSNFFLNGGTGLPNPADAGIASIGIYMLDKCDGTYVQNGDIILCYKDLLTHVTGTHRPGYSNFDNVYFDSSTYGIELRWAKSMRFTACWVSSRTEAGITLAETDTITFVAPKIVWCGKEGVYIDQSASRTVFIAPTIDGCSTVSPGTYHGFVLGNNATGGLQIIGGTIGNNSTLPPGFNTGSNGYGIVISTGAGNYLIDGVDLRNNSLGPMAGHSYGVEKIVQNCRGFVNKARGKAVIANGSSSVTVTHGLAGVPTHIVATPADRALGDTWVSSANRTSTTFTINQSNAAVGYPVNYDWVAYYE